MRSVLIRYTSSRFPLLQSSHPLIGMTLSLSFFSRLPLLSAQLLFLRARVSNELLSSSACVLWGVTHAGTCGTTQHQ